MRAHARRAWRREAEPCAHGRSARPIDRIDGPAKVTGTAPYADDSRADAHGASAPSSRPPSAAAASPASTPTPRARMPGVLLVMTHENAPPQAPFQAKAERSPRPAQAAARRATRCSISASRWRSSWPRRSSRRARRRRLVDGHLRRRPRAPSSSNRPARDGLRPRQRATGAPADSEVGDFDSGLRRRAGDGSTRSTRRPIRTTPDGAARQPRLVGGRQAHGPQRPADGRERAQVDRRHAEDSRPTRSMVSSATSAAASAASCRSMPTRSSPRWPRASSSGR